jgi:hypothetical protein
MPAEHGRVLGMFNVLDHTTFEHCEPGQLAIEVGKDTRQVQLHLSVHVTTSTYVKRSLMSSP